MDCSGRRNGFWVYRRTAMIFKWMTACCVRRDLTLGLKLSIFWWWFSQLESILCSIFQMGQSRNISESTVIGDITAPELCLPVDLILAASKWWGWLIVSPLPVCLCMFAEFNLVWRKPPDCDKKSETFWQEFANSRLICCFFSCQKSLNLPNEQTESKRMPSWAARSRTNCDQLSFCWHWRFIPWKQNQKARPHVHLAAVLELSVWSYTVFHSRVCPFVTAIWMFTFPSKTSRPCWHKGWEFKFSHDLQNSQKVSIPLAVLASAQTRNQNVWQSKYIN